MMMKMEVIVPPSPSSLDEEEINEKSWEGNNRTLWLEKEQTHPLSKELKKHWTERSHPKDEWIEKFVTKMVKGFPEHAEKYENISGYRRRKRFRKETIKKRRRYANAQELYKKCPSKLAEMLRNNGLDNFLESEEIPVQDAEIYNKLWGSKGECYLKLKKKRNTS